MATATLAQVNAVRGQKKADFEAIENDLFQELARHPERFSGHSKIYQPLNETPDGVTPEQQPSNVKLPQYRVDDELQRLGKALGIHLDVELQLDRGNQEACADVQLPGGPTLEKVPVTTLLYWGKLIGRLHQVVSRMPILEPGLPWKRERDAATGFHTTEVVETRHTKKTRRFTVPIQPTEHQPGQYAEWDEDVRVGTWKNTQLSGALTRDDKVALLERIRLVQEAVQVAREKANALPVTTSRQGTELLTWLLAPLAASE